MQCKNLCTFFFLTCISQLWVFTYVDGLYYLYARCLFLDSFLFILKFTVPKLWCFTFVSSNPVHLRNMSWVYSLILFFFFCPWLLSFFCFLSGFVFRGHLIKRQKNKEEEEEEIKQKNKLNFRLYAVIFLFYFCPHLLLAFFVLVFVFCFAVAVATLQTKEKRKKKLEINPHVPKAYHITVLDWCVNLTTTTTTKEKERETRRYNIYI